jgi:hypothetical protein
MIPRMIALPALITLAVTILRLTGELRHWSPRWFSSETGGIQPSGVSWLFGITWLAAIFGAYFAVKLVRGGQGPRSLSKASFLAGSGVVIFLLFRPVVQFVSTRLQVGFPEYLIAIWLLWVLAGILQYFGWPRLFKVLLAYAYAARIPVAIVMLFAMIGNWGTHYDYVGINIPLQGVSRYLWLAFFPQLIAWVAFTVTLGTAAGILAILIGKLARLPIEKKFSRIDPA